MVVAALYTFVTQPSAGLCIYSLTDKTLLNVFAEDNADNCVLGGTHLRATSILNIGKSLFTKNRDVFDALVAQQIQPCLDDYLARFNIGSIKAETDWLLLKYDKGHYFKSHCDRDVNYNRDISVVVFANDNYSGGELVFDKINVTVKPVRGQIVIFPSFFLFSHEVKPILEGTKYSLVNWYFLSGD